VLDGYVGIDVAVVAVVVVVDAVGLLVAKDAGLWKPYVGFGIILRFVIIVLDDELVDVDDLTFLVYYKNYVKMFIL
jgi:hypothetical protein